MAVAKVKLEVLDETPLVNDLHRGITKQTKTYSLNGEKFQIRFENSNGSPMGFNYKMCLAQYSKADGKWNNLEDIKVLNLGPIPSYYSAESNHYMQKFFKLMEERLVKIYS
jgi:hypothetical protein